MTNGTPAAYEMWMMELVRLTARRLGSSVTLLGGAPDPYEQRMIKSATPNICISLDCGNWFDNRWIRVGRFLASQ